MHNKILEIKNFSKTYPGGKRAVDGLSLDIFAGDIYGFIGQNGAGKTTTLRAVSGILQFDEGEILIDGHSVKAQPVLCKSISAYIPDNPVRAVVPSVGFESRRINFFCGDYSVPKH